MSIVIDEFEVVMDQPPIQPEQPDVRSETERKRPLRPEEIIQIQQRNQKRIRRIWAD